MLRRKKDDPNLIPVGVEGRCGLKRTVGVALEASLPLDQLAQKRAK